MYVNLFRIFCSFYFVGFSFFYYLKPHGIAQPEHIPFPWVASPRNGVPWIAQNRLKPSHPPKKRVPFESSSRLRREKNDDLSPNNFTFFRRFMMDDRVIMDDYDGACIKKTRTFPISLQWVIQFGRCSWDLVSVRAHLVEHRSEYGSHSLRWEALQFIHF